MLLVERKHGGQSDHSKSNNPYHALEIPFTQRIPLSMMRHKLTLIEAIMLEAEKSMSLELGYGIFRTKQHFHVDCFDWTSLHQSLVIVHSSASRETIAAPMRFRDHVISHYLLIAELVRLLLIGQLLYPIGHNSAFRVCIIHMVMGNLGDWRGVGSLIARL